MSTIFFHSIKTSLQSPCGCFTAVSAVKCLSNAAITWLRQVWNVFIGCTFGFYTEAGFNDVLFVALFVMTPCHEIWIFRFSFVRKSFSLIFAFFFCSLLQTSKPIFPPKTVPHLQDLDCTRLLKMPLCIRTLGTNLLSTINFELLRQSINALTQIILGQELTTADTGSSPQGLVFWKMYKPFIWMI